MFYLSANCIVVLSAFCPVEISSLTPHFNAVIGGPAERKTVSNGFPPGWRLPPG
jgi:hypothetical protein